jgi:hypothetical protein
MTDIQVVDSVVYKLATGRLDEAQLVCEIAAFEKFESFRLLYASCFAARKDLTMLEIILEDDKYTLQPFLDAFNSATQTIEDSVISPFGRYILTRLAKFKGKSCGIERYF